MKIVFMGTPEFAVVSLNALVEKKHTVAAVVTVPDKAQGRGLKVKSSPVKEYALQHNIPILQPEDLKDQQFIETLDAYKVDCFVVVAFKILPKVVFSLPHFGTVNVHASLLPAYRGAAPINWAIMNGESKTGVTTMFIDAKVDTGDILMQSEVDILPDMNAGELHDILADEGAGLLVKTLLKIETNDLNPIAQDDSKATRAPKLNNENCIIDFNKSAKVVHNQIRGLSPYPAAFTFLDNKKVKIYKSLPEDNKINQPPGTIQKITRDSFSVACADRTVRILELQIEGKKRMTVKDFLNGHTLNTADSFKSTYP